jgi:hypothetical protein
VNIPMKDMGAKNCLSDTKLYFWPEGCQPARGQNQHKRVGNLFPLISPLYP